MPVRRTRRAAVARQRVGELPGAHQVAVRAHAEYLPGYVEWLSCIQMMRDVLRLRKQEGPSAPGVGAGRRTRVRRTALPSGRECPAVKYTENGSIDYVINC